MGEFGEIPPGGHAEKSFKLAPGNYVFLQHRHQERLAATTTSAAAW